MKQNRITTVQDLGSSPHSGKPLVMGSTVFNEDCMTVMARYPDKFFDLAVVDPPYGIDRFQKNVESKSRKRFTNKMNNWDVKPDQKYFTELFRISKNQIIWGVNHFWTISPFFSLPNCSHFIFWDKKQPVKNFAAGEIAWTSFDGVAAKFEYAWGGLSDGILGRNKTEKNIHPTQKPIALYDWIFTNYANQSVRCGHKHTAEYNHLCSICKHPFKVLDTHLGSGSSRIAAHKHNLEFIGCEIDAEYFAAQEARFKEFTSQLRLFG